MKKIMSFILSFMIILSCLVSPSIFAIDTYSAIIEADPDIIERGNDVKISITLPDNLPNLCTMGITIAYNQEQFNIKSNSSGWTFLDSEIPGIAKGNWTSNDAINGDNVSNVTYDFVFTSEMTAEANEYDFEVKFIADDTYDVNYNPISITAGTVIVTITVPEISATDITLDPTTITLTEGDTVTLTATLTPVDSTDKITWSSSSEAIATVDENGVVTAVAEGTATITAKANDTVSATCTVTVEKAACTHENKTTHPAVSSTCITLGNNLYYTCNDCQKVFKADGVTETTVEAETLTEYGEHVEATPATCTELAICKVCGQAYGELKAHEFTEKLEDAEHLASAGDCQTLKTYFYDCANCDLKGTETFEGSTYGDHNVSEAWTTENGKHFHECTVDGCDYIEDEAECSGGTATCTTLAVCSVCKKEYGKLADHDYKTEWNQGDENGHWHDCKNCTAHDEQQPHIPGAEATEDTAQTCTECGYVIAPATGHIKHVADTSKWLYDEDQHWHKCVGCDMKLDVEDHHGGTATCTELAICKVCEQAYGKLSVHVDEDGDELCDECGGNMHKHSYAEEWSMNAEKHWHECECGDKVDEAVHTAGKWIVDKEATSEAEGQRHIECTVCGYVMAIEKIPVTDTGFDYDEWYWHMMILMNQKYTITANAGEGGSISNEGRTTVKYSNNITYTITPDEGYEIEAVIVDGKDIGAVSEYTFKRVQKDHTISVIFTETKWDNPFTDIAENDWYYEDVEFVYENDLMIGTSDTKFSPDAIVNRAMIVTILWRLEGSPVVDSPVDFTDVPAGEWYTNAVNWASANGIVNGYGNDTFGPLNDLTREQIMAILNRYAVYKEWTDNVIFPMIPQYNYSIWAENNVIWADMNGMLDGIGVDVSDLTKAATRAEVAAYLRRFCENIAE